MRKKKRNILTLPRNKDNPISKKPSIRKSVAKQASRDNSDSQSLVSFAMDRAQEVRANLSPEFPSFLKPVHRSNVAGRFCLYLPKEFCDANLPNHDDSVVLVDENEEEYHVKYVLLRNKLDGGWRGFSNAQKLMEGDVLVFHLFDHCKFKVYIVRAADDRALVLLNSDFHAKPIDTDQHGRFSKPMVNFKDMKCFEDFQIRVDGLILHSEIPGHLRRNYYKLCCSQEMFLHDNLIEGLNSKLAAGMISETTNIADSIRAANLSTSLQRLKFWDNTLEALEILGMSVNFLRARLNKLIRLACKSKVIVESKSEENALDDDSRALNGTVLKTNLLLDGLETEAEALEMKKEMLIFKFKELASAPW